MKAVILFLMVFLLTLATAMAQKLYMEVQNLTGRPLRVTEITYSDDSTWGNSVGSSGIRNGLLMEGWVKNHHWIRMDVVAIDDSTNDTLYTNSFRILGLEEEYLNIDISTGLRNPLTNDMNPSPRLQIRSKDETYLLRKGAMITVRTESLGKIEGIVTSFDEGSIYLTSNNGEQIMVTKDDLLAIRTSGHHLYIGAWSFFPYKGWIRFERKTFKVVNFQADGGGWE